MHPISSDYKYLTAKDVEQYIIEERINLTLAEKRMHALIVKGMSEINRLTKKLETNINPEEKNDIKKSLNSFENGLITLNSINEKAKSIYKKIK